ncbi:MAG: 16S rRNA (adenine(1518)-N(6)/adenine(1519)-N(6))-dimethyltransferase RsmA [Terriglobales bacterium]
MPAPRGQNFLYQPQWLRRVAAAVGPAVELNDALLEIGGGPGGLSELLAESSRRLWVVEVDPALAEGLRRRLNSAHVTVLHADILNLDLRALATQHQVERWRIAGNLPYYITSPILLYLFRHAALITDATVMVQREVAERLCASPGKKDFGLLSATTQFYAKPERLFDIPPGAFRPAPKVHSTLVRLTMAPQAEKLGVEAEPFLRFLQRGFAHKRKQLASFLGDPARAGLSPRARAEDLSLVQWAELYRTMDRRPRV